MKMEYDSYIPIGMCNGVSVCRLPLLSKASEIYLPDAIPFGNSSPSYQSHGVCGVNHE